MEHDNAEHAGYVSTSFLTCPRLASTKGGRNNTKWLLGGVTNQYQEELIMFISKLSFYSKNHAICFLRIFWKLMN
jgi:hypothetical protein